MHESGGTPSSATTSSTGATPRAVNPPPEKQPPLVNSLLKGIPLDIRRSSTIPTPAFLDIERVRARDSSRIGNGPVVKRVLSQYSEFQEEEGTDRDFHQEEEGRELRAIGKRWEGRDVEEGHSLDTMGSGEDGTDPSRSTSRLGSGHEDHSFTSTRRRERSSSPLIPPLEEDLLRPLPGKGSRDPLVEFPSTSTKSPVSSPLPVFKSARISRTYSEESTRARTNVGRAVQKARNSFSLSRGSVPSGVIEEMQSEKEEERKRQSASWRGSNGGVQLFDIGSGEEEKYMKAQERRMKAGSAPAESPFQNISSRPPTQSRIEVLVLDEQGKPIPQYKLQPGSTRFFLGGRLLSSRDNPTPFIICLFFAISLPVLFLAFSGPFLWTHLEAGGKASLFLFLYLAVLMVVNMLKTSWRDPGIIPRQLDLTPEKKWYDDLGAGEGGYKAEPRYMRIKDGVVPSKWCTTCETYRPPRTSHCRLCDNCVEHTDHHCTFLNTCIGRRNYNSFFVFLVSTILACSYVISFSAYHISTLHTASLDPTSDFYGRTWSNSPNAVGSVIVAILSFLLTIPIAGLLMYHMRLVWSNRTTIEMLRPKAERSGTIDPDTGLPLGNLYSFKSPWKNFISLLCRPQAPSWIEGRKYAQRDDRVSFDSEERGLHPGQQLE